MEPKDWLLNVMGVAADEQRQFVLARSHAERACDGLISDWSITSPKAIISHIDMWNGRMLENLRAALRGDVPVPFSDGPALNDSNYLAQRERECARIAADAQDTLTRMSRMISDAPDSALVSTSLHPGQTRPLWRIIPGVVLTHASMHYIDYEVAHGKLDSAASIGQRLFDVTSLSEGEQSRGTALYNHACLFAKLGRLDEAVQLLAQSLKVLPHMVEPSKTDSDLVALHALPAFKAIYAARV